MIKKTTTLQAGKTYTIRNNGSTYTIILGEISESASFSSSQSSSTSTLRTGAGIPSPTLGAIGDVFVDVLNKKVFTRDSTGWDTGLNLGGSSADSPFQIGTGAPSLNLSPSISAYVDIQSMNFHTRSNGSWDSGRAMRGSSGQNGKSVHFGNGAPLSSLGVDSETYIDLSDFKIHTKSAGSWSSGQVFKGNNGQNGLNGKSLRFGNGLPSDSEGDDDEVYLDLSNFKIHSKSAGSWGSGHVFKGNDGQNGSNGKSVRFGSGIPSDSNGDDDEAYIDLENFKIHCKSNGCWDAGAAFKGSNGLNGQNGLNGKSIRFGNGAPLDTDGENDEVYLDLSNFKIHSKSADAWNGGHVFKGSDGIKGADGLPGSDGKHGVAAQLTNDSDVISSNSDGSGYDFTYTGGEFEIRSGGTKVSSNVTYYAGASGTSSTSTVNGLTLTINSSGAYSLSGASWTQNFARFTMRAIYDGITYTKVYKVTKARAGLKGSDGLDGSNGLNGLNGTNGKDGSNGADALTGYLSNEADVLSAASDGTGYSLAGTGGTFYVYSGKTLVTPSNFYVGPIGTSTTQTVNGLTISINSSGVYSVSGASWTSDSVSFTLRAVYSGTTLTKTYKITKSKSGSKGDKGDTGNTGPGVKVYCVALGSDSSASDVELTTSYADMYLADVVTNEGNILSASSVKGGATTFTINSAGRYKIELQAAFRIKNVTKGSTYSTTCYAQIIKGATTPAAIWSSNTSTLSANLALYAVNSAAYASSTVEISKTVFLAAGTTLKVQAKTSNVSGGSSYLELATDSEVQSAEDTILTITKL